MRAKSFARRLLAPLYTPIYLRLDEHSAVISPLKQDKMMLGSKYANATHRHEIMMYAIE